MRITKQSSKAKQYNVHCVCGGRFVADASDALRIEYDSRDGDAYVFKCPCCGLQQWVNINKAEMPRSH